jgi:hypothetical protein
MIAQGIRVLHFPPSRLRTAKREIAQQTKSTLARKAGQMPKARTRSIADRDRDYKALDMARRGLTHRQIAAELGWRSHTTVGDHPGAARDQPDRR